VLFEGSDITDITPEQRAALGLARTFQVPQTCEGMTVLENVMIGAFLRTSHRHEAETKARAVLERVGMIRLADAPARSLGTPGRKRLEVARALATEPKVLLLDEPSLGLAPAVVESMYETFGRLHREGLTILLAEQSIELALEVSDFATVLQVGKSVLSGTAAALAEDPQVQKAYLGWTDRSPLVQRRQASANSVTLAQLARRPGDWIVFSDALGFDVGVARQLLKQGEDGEGVAYLEAYIAQGSVMAMIEMAECLDDKGDQSSSLALMERAEALIAADDCESWLYLAGALRRGLGAGTAKERYFRALDLKERVAEAGHLATIREMILNCFHGLNGATKDRERTIYWVRKAAALGDEKAKQILREEGLL
jgi:ABC-type branched-subunit amino acid transport system ATPase component